MLDNAFLAHDGWKIPKQFYAKKESDTAQNWVLFNYHFKDEMQRKYQTSRTCSPVEPWLPPKLRQQGKKPLHTVGFKNLGYFGFHFFRLFLFNCFFMRTWSRQNTPSSKYLGHSGEIYASTSRQINKRPIQKDEIFVNF